MHTETLPVDAAMNSVCHVTAMFLQLRMPCIEKSDMAARPTLTQGMAPGASAAPLGLRQVALAFGHTEYGAFSMHAAPA